MGCACSAWAGVTIDGTEYSADTMLHRQIGPGVVQTIVRLPQYPLNVFVLETDLNNPYNRVETTVAQNRLGTTELLSNAYKRNRTSSKQPLAAVNSNFWCTTEQPYAQYMKTSPFGSCVRNDTVYANNNYIVDKWIAGPANSGGVAIDHDKRMWVGRFIWTGTVSSSKLSKQLSISEVNQRCLQGYLALWNVAYTRTRQFETNWTAHATQGTTNADNYYLTFVPGSSWQVNQPMTFTVSKVVKGADRQTLGDYDACLTASGAMATSMATLAEGDTVNISQGWFFNDGTARRPWIENMVEGNAPVMMNGKLTDRNYTLAGGNDTYNNRAYSRTGMGTSADGKHLYMIVIEMTTNPVYGRSAGCSTAVMCQILKSLCPDVTDITSHDSGGSAQMMVGGTVVNKTTESTPRAVQNGLMVFSTAPRDEKIASIAFDGDHLRLPIYASSQPRVLGYNQYGDLVSDSVAGVTLSCDATLGTCEGPTFTASGNVTDGTLTATVGGMRATVRVTTMAAQPEIVLKPMITVDQRSWPLEVTATVNAKTYSYDASRLQWAVADPSVAVVEGGKIRGLRNGITTLTCQIGDQVDTDSVTVQISDAAYKQLGWEGWEFTGSGATSISIDGSGTVSYTYGTSRSPYLAMSKNAQFYGLPDSVGLTFTSSLALSYVQIDARTPLITAQNYHQLNNDGKGFEAGKTYTVKLDLQQLGGADRLTTFPISIENMRFAIKKASATKSAQTLQLHSLYAHYPVTGGIKGDLDGNGLVNAADVTALINMILGISPSNPQADLNADQLVNAADVTALVNIILGK